MTARKTDPKTHRVPTVPLAVVDGTIERVPDAPEHLAAAGKKRWAQVWAKADQWLVAALDQSLLVRYCELHDDRAAFRQIVAKEGRMAEGSMRQPIVHPAVAEIAKIDAMLLRMEEALGFTPHGRQALRIERTQKPKAMTKLEELRQRRSSTVA